MKINCVCCAVLSRVWLFATTWSVAHQAPLSMGFSRQEYWRGHHSLLQGIFPSRGWKPHLLHLLHWQACSLPLRHLESSNLLQLKKKARATIFAAEITSSYFLIFHQYLSGLSHPAKTKLVFLLMLIFKVNNIHFHFWLPFCLIGNIGWVLNSTIFYQFSMKHGVILAHYKSNELLYDHRMLTGFWGKLYSKFQTTGLQTLL